MEEKSKHIMFIQKVKSEKKEEYTRAHKDAWPDLLKVIKDSGIDRELIWLFGDYICIYMMTDDFDGAMSRLSKTDVFKKWSEYMGTLLAEMQDYSQGGGNVITLEKVFDLEEQLKPK
ncbi:MAG: L-rhamnose mutarotase [Actinobacteria bacterium]|nr:L-rhamnose mutarotase [Actinomycetota bacterium]MCL5072031.1 L-rhamnose mutarotase [Actinomycetota bacterium]